MATLIAGLLLFFAAHSFTILREQRQKLVDRFGPNGYRALYSVVSLAGFVLIVMGYGDASRVDLWSPGPAMRMIAIVLMVPVFILFASSYLPGHIKQRVGNPQLIGLKTWAFAHLLANGDVASVLLFGSFLTWAVADLIAVKRQGRSAAVAQPKIAADVGAVVIGLAVFALIYFKLHVYLSGMPLTG